MNWQKNVLKQLSAFKTLGDLISPISRRRLGFFLNQHNIFGLTQLDISMIKHVFAYGVLGRELGGHWWKGTGGNA